MFSSMVNVYELFVSKGQIAGLHPLPWTEEDLLDFSPDSMEGQIFAQVRASFLQGWEIGWS